VVFKKTTTRILLGTVAAAALIGSALVPAQAATRDTIVLQENNFFGSFNTTKKTTNVVINSTVNSLMGMGFWYYNDEADIVRNTDFGTYSITSRKPLTVKMTVKPGRVWSDGTPITAVDLLLSHVICSPTYSKAAGIGDPSKSGDTAFESTCYTGTYGKLVTKEPVVSGDRMSLTLTFDSPTPDYQLYLPGPSAVHGLVLMTDGKKGLTTNASVNRNAKTKFFTAYQNKDTAYLKKLAACWNNCYDIAETNEKTNNLAYISNGGFIVSKIVKNNSVTLVRNTRYNSGPKFTGNVQTVIIRSIDNPTAALQALKNKEIDVYAGQATADLASQLRAMPGVRTIGGNANAWEHVDLRFDTTFGEKDTYKGVFADKGTAAEKAQALDLRRAFLLAWPRDEIVEKIYQPINPNTKVMNSIFYFPEQPAYKGVVASNGSDYYTEGTQAQRTARALALVQKHYPKASATTAGFDVNFNWGTPTNARRVATIALAKAALAKAGINLIAPGNANWNAEPIVSSSYDGQMFAWVKTTISQSIGCNGYTYEENLSGYNGDSVIKSLCDPLVEEPQENSLVIKNLTAIEKKMHDDAFTLSVARHANVVGVNEDLDGIRLGFYPQITWNFWEWKFTK